VDTEIQRVIAAQYDQHGKDWHAQRGSGHELLEKPAIYNLLPDITNKRVLCLGCGFGEECARLHHLGASEIVGIDLSEANIAEAKERYRNIDFRVMNMEKLAFPQASFDIVFSSLALHYLRDWGRVLGEINKVLSPQGVVVLSTHHPAAWSALREENETSKTQLLGYELEKSSGQSNFYGDYLNERPITTKFSGKFEATFFHKTFSGMWREFVQAGFRVIDCTEPSPIEEAKQRDPQFWEIRSRFPLFILFRLEKER
jgi:SAM-dependent methyltransferase